MDVQVQTIGSAPPASEREEHFADTAPVSPRKIPELVGDATEEIKRLREQLIECDDEIRDLRYRMHLRGYNPTLW